MVASGPHPSRRWERSNRFEIAAFPDTWPVSGPRRFATRAPIMRRHPLTRRRELSKFADQSKRFDEFDAIDGSATAGAGGVGDLVMHPTVGKRLMSSGAEPRR